MPSLILLELLHIVWKDKLRGDEIETFAVDVASDPGQLRERILVAKDTAGGVATYHLVAWGCAQPLDNLLVLHEGTNPSQPGLLVGNHGLPNRIPLYKFL